MKRIVLGWLTASLVVFIVGSVSFVGQTQTLPAPTVDRVGFPTGYKETYKASHTVPVSSAAGTWTITGVRAHQDEGDHTGSYIAT